MSDLFSTDGGILLFPISDAEPDAVSIVRWLNELAVEFGRNPTIRELTEVVLPPGLENNDIAGQISACTEFVKDRVTYVADPEGTEYVKSPLVMFQDILLHRRTLGDCDDHCLLLTAMLRCLGIPARIAGVKQGPASTYFDHVVVQVPTVDRGWRVIDPCAKSVQTPNYPEFLVVEA